MSVQQSAATLFALARGDAADLAALRSCGDDIAEGARIQLAVLEGWRQLGEELGGWKIGMSSRGLRDSMGTGVRPFGFVLASRILASGAELDVSRVPDCLLEPEICVTMGAPLGGPDVTEEQAKAAVASVSPAFEICSKRLPSGMPRSVRIGNDLNNWGIVVGPEHSTDIALDRLAVELFRDGEPIDSGHSGQDVIDSPYLSLARVCRTLADHGLALAAGQRLITGSVLAGARVAGHSRFTARFGELGEVTVTVRS
ncbi:MAG TPA: hypothetical protein VFW65_10270 [Pseudonocardiaceae bacterium]|nr:hypothetical protein [Pseudonocardiaceae bacterium]